MTNRIEGEEQQDRVPWLWLCLSGGGFRAALFHYGCLKRLHELSLLEYGYAYSATSGGALVAALLACNSDGELNVDWEPFERTLLSLATRGILGHVALLVSAYSFYVLFALCFFWLPRVAIIIGATGLLLHLALAFALLAEGVHKHSEEEQCRSGLLGQPDSGIYSRISIARFFRSLLLPSYLRRTILNVRAFRWRLLTEFFKYPYIYLTALDLNAGTEKVFTQGGKGVVTDLDALGCRELWEQSSNRESREIPDVEIASAVAASTAIPPLFRPVTIQSRGRVTGVFVDGGVVDNFATNVPKALATHIHRDRGQRYDGSSDSVTSFSEATKYVAILDGSKGSDPQFKSSWRYPSALFRIVNLLSDEQAQDMKLTAFTFGRLAGIPTFATGLSVGFPDHSPFAITNRYISRIRTQLDAFSAMECAALAYCGYLCAEELIPNFPALHRCVDPNVEAPLKSFEDILPPPFGPVTCTLDQLQQHLRYSNFQIEPLRWFARALARLRLGTR